MKREIAIRLRRKLRKFPALATHVEKIAERCCREIVCLVVACKIKLSFSQIKRALIATKLEGVFFKPFFLRTCCWTIRWEHWLCLCRWWVEQWLASLSECSGSPRSRLVEFGGDTSFLENVLERWKYAGKLSVWSWAVKHHLSYSNPFIFFLFIFLATVTAPFTAPRLPWWSKVQSSPSSLTLYSLPWTPWS